MQQQLAEFVEGEVRYFSSFYSVAAMDGQTVQHLQDIICQYTKDDVTTIMYVLLANSRERVFCDAVMYSVLRRKLLSTFDPNREPCPKKIRKAHENED